MSCPLHNRTSTQLYQPPGKDVLLEEQHSSHISLTWKVCPPNMLSLQPVVRRSSSLLNRSSTQLCQALDRISSSHLHNRTNSQLCQPLVMMSSSHLHNRTSRQVCQPLASMFFSSHLIPLWKDCLLAPFTTGSVAIPWEECSSAPSTTGFAARSTSPCEG